MEVAQVFNVLQFAGIMTLLAESAQNLERNSIIALPAR
jgi:hypothetical protein